MRADFASGLVERTLSALHQLHGRGAGNGLGHGEASQGVVCRFIGAGESMERRPAAPS